VLIGLIDPAPHNCTNFVLDELWLIPITEPSTVRRFGQNYFFHLLNYQFVFHPRTYPAHLPIPFTHTTQYPPTHWHLTTPSSIFKKHIFIFLTWPSLLPHGEGVVKDIFLFPAHSLSSSIKKFLLLCLKKMTMSPSSSSSFGYFSLWCNKKMTRRWLIVIFLPIVREVFH
jgi:hypothetical protein